MPTVGKRKFGYKPEDISAAEQYATETGMDIEYEETGETAIYKKIQTGGSPYRMKGFSGFGNSPSNKNGKPGHRVGSKKSILEEIGTKAKGMSKTNQPSYTKAMTKKTIDIAKKVPIVLPGVSYSTLSKGFSKAKEYLSKKKIIGGFFKD